MAPDDIRCTLMSTLCTADSGRSHVADCIEHCLAMIIDCMLAVVDRGDDVHRRAVDTAQRDGPGGRIKGPGARHGFTLGVRALLIEAARLAEESAVLREDHAQFRYLAQAMSVLRAYSLPVYKIVSTSRWDFPALVCPPP